MRGGGGDGVLVRGAVRRRGAAVDDVGDGAGRRIHAIGVAGMQGPRLQQLISLTQAPFVGFGGWVGRFL